MSRFGGSEFGGGNPEIGPQIPHIPPPDRSWRRPFYKIPEVTEPPEVPKITEVPEVPESPADRPSVLEESPKLPPARRFKLTVGHPGSDHVVVEEIKLDSIPRDVVISRSRGVQIGKHNRQLNDYRYELDKPTASIDDVFEGHPVRQWAFEKLVDNPDSMVVNFFFRTLLPEGPLYSGGRIGFAETGRQEVRITARLGDQGAILVDKSWGVEVGNWNTQRNRFLYRIEQPEFHLEAALRDPDVARGLAVAVKYPDRPAAQLSLIRRLQGTSDGSSWSIGDVYTKFSAAIPRPVTGDGVQLGYADTRNDKVRIRAGKVILTGWERIRELKADDQERDQRLQESHQSRISMSRPADFVTEDTTRGPENFLRHFIERTATATLHQVAPGRPHLVAGMVEEIKTALDTPEESGNDHAAGVQVSLAARKGTLGFWGGTVLSGLGVQHLEADLAKGFRQEQDGEQAFDLPYLELVEFVGHEQLLCQPGGATTEETEVVWQQDVPPSGSDSTGPSRAIERQAASDALAPIAVPTAPLTNSAAAVSPATEARTEAMIFRDRSRTVVATGAVVCGPLAAIAATMGTRFLDAGLLLAYVRRRVWDHRYDGGHHSVAPAMRAVQALQVVVFLDPFIGMGLWVDVDPARQAPAAVLLIEIDLSAGAPGRCRIFRS